MAQQSRMGSAMTTPSPVPPAAEGGLMVAAERAVVVLATVLRSVVGRLERMRLPAPAAVPGTRTT